MTFQRMQYGLHVQRQEPQMMTKAELAALEDFLEAPWGAQAMRDALDEVIRMADVNRDAWDAKDRARIKRSRAIREDRVIP